MLAPDLLAYCQSGRYPQLPPAHQTVFICHIKLAHSKLIKLAQTDTQLEPLSCNKCNYATLILHALVICEQGDMTLHAASAVALIVCHRSLSQCTSRFGQHCSTAHITVSGKACLTGELAVS